MILVAVGTQFPFDRLVRAVDAWAGEVGRADVVAQIGPSSYVPGHMRSFGLVAPGEFRKLHAEAEVVVAHAGMGSILSALEAATPIIIMPRDHALGEHRNDHQKATARRFGDVKGIYVAQDEGQLRDYLERVGELTATAGISSRAPGAFVDRLRAFVTAEAPKLSWGGHLKALLSARRG